MNKKHYETCVMCYANVNVNLTVKNVFQIKFGITINVNMSAKIQGKLCVEKVIFGILLHVAVKMVVCRRHY